MAGLTTLSKRKIGVLKWFIPLGLVVTVIIYEVGPSRWIYNRYGFNFHLTVEILLFGTVGPVLAFLMWELLSRWIGEKETADLQANMLAKAEQKDREIRQLNDDTLQVLFATYMLISAIKTDAYDLPQATMSQIEVTEKALDESISTLRFYLLT